MQKTTKHQKLNLLQVFRGLAAVMVILAHCDLIFNQNFRKTFSLRYLTLVVQV
jgi:peptidoglycan/LPS O-acetylase OafA/YrhL